METSVFLSNREVVAVEGIRRSGKVEISRIVRAEAPKNSILNGIVTDEPGFDRFFCRFWKENELADRHVTLVLGNVQAVTRNLKLPPMSHAHRMRYLNYEFADVARTKDPVISYVKIGDEGVMEQVLASVAEKEFLEKHVRRFEDMGVRLESVVLAETADILALYQVLEIRGRSCIVQVPDGISILNILYINGHYVRMNRTRMLSEPGTHGYGTECACLVSSLCKYAAEKMPETPVTHVYLAGGFQPEEYEICRCSILKKEHSLKVEPLEVGNSDRIRFATESYRRDFSRNMAAIGGLLVSGKKNNLLYQYRLSLECVKRKNLRIRCLCQCLAVIGIPGMIIFGQRMYGNHLRALVETQQEYLEQAEKMKLATEFEQRKQEIEEMQKQTDAIKTISERLAGFPSYTSEVYQTLEACADGLAEFEVESYYGFALWEEKGSGGTCRDDAEENKHAGELVVGIRCDAPEHIHRFVKRLESQQAVIQSAEYTGFVLDEKQDSWTAQIRIRLADQGGAVWE